MDKDLLKLKKIVSFMKKEGVLSVKTPEGLEINVSQSSFAPERSKSSKKNKADEAVKEGGPDSPSEYDVLFWSSVSLPNSPEEVN